jgi:RHS repeat-associated protein
VGSLGYYFDNESGLHLLTHRYLDTAVGRFASWDPIKDGVNWYGYVEDNPSNQVDPLGLIPGWFVVVGVVIIVGVGIILSVSIYGRYRAHKIRMQPGQCPEGIDLPLCAGADRESHIMDPRWGHFWGRHGLPTNYEDLYNQCLGKIVRTSTPIWRGNHCRYEGACNGVQVVITVGYGRDGWCISDAWHR